MNFAFNAEEEAFQRELKVFFEKEVPAHLKLPMMILAIDSSDKTMQKEWREMARKLGQRGWLSLAWPKEWGGLEASYVMQFMLVEAMMYYSGMGFDVQGTGLVAPLLLHFGTEQQKRQHLPPIAQGEITWCQCLSEPESGSDLASIKTQAVPDGNDFIINGQKVWVSRAHQADWGHLLVRTDPEAPQHRGISYFLVDMSSPGITVNPLNGMYGGQSMCEVFFDNLRVPRENLVGKLNQGWSMVLSTLEMERALYMEQVGVGRRVLEMLVEYANEKGMAKVPHVRQGLADMATELKVCQLIGYRTARLLDSGVPAPGEGSMSKIINTEWAQRWADTGMKILGPYGQLAEDSELAQLAGRIQHWYIRSFGITIASGTSEIERTVLATRGLGLPRG